MAPNHTSDFSDPTGCYNPISTQYNQMPSHQQQFDYPGWGYTVSHKYTEATGNYHFSYYQPAHCSSPVKDDSFESGKRNNFKENKMRKSKTSFTYLQLQRLKPRFQQNQYPDYSEQVELASTLGVCEHKVKNWFKNQRAQQNKKIKASKQVGDGGGYLPPSDYNGIEGRPHQKKPRTVFSYLQLKQLNRRFQRSQYLNRPERAELAASLGLAEYQVGIWFHNRRIRERKVMKVAQQFGGGGGNLNPWLGGNNGLGTHQPIHQQYEGMSYGEVPPNELENKYQGGEENHWAMQEQQMEEAADEVANMNYNWQYFYEL